MKRRPRYKFEFRGYIEHDFPPEVLSALARCGWDVLGVWERVEGIRREWKRRGYGTIRHDPTEPAPCPPTT